MKKKRILIADDEADIALILKLQLEDTGYTTERARDGAEALELLRRRPYDLLLLDIKMPNMDGVEAARIVARSALYREESRGFHYRSDFPEEDTGVRVCPGGDLCRFHRFARRSFQYRKI